MFSLKESLFKIGDKVVIKVGVHKNQEGLIKNIAYNIAWNVWQYTVNIVDPFDGVESDMVFAEEHLMPLEAETRKPKTAQIKDSGERTEFSSGAVRDMHSGKGDMLSVPWAAMLRVSKHYENGAAKYGRYNYLKGIPVSSFIDSALRHLAKYVAGWDDEDHLAAAAFNVLGAIQMEEHNPDMCDLPWREGKRSFHYEDNKPEGGNSEKVSADIPD
jgi:hypothetical protein